MHTSHRSYLGRKPLLPKPTLDPSVFRPKPNLSSVFNPLNKSGLVWIYTGSQTTLVNQNDEERSLEESCIMEIYAASPSGPTWNIDRLKTCYVHVAHKPDG